jgi:hypothetical protein
MPDMLAPSKPRINSGVADKKAAERPKLSDGGHEKARLKPRRDAAVRWSAWLGITSNSKQNMKIKVPSKTVEACDICKRAAGILETCLICGKEYCWSCEPYLPGCMMKPHVCKNCDDRKDVLAVVARYSVDFVKIYKLRDKALARLPRNAVMPNGLHERPGATTQKETNAK